MTSPDATLFQDGDLDSWLDMRLGIALLLLALDEDATNSEELIESVVSQNLVKPVEIFEHQLEVDESDGTTYTFHLPFTGEPRLLALVGSVRPSLMPKGGVFGQEIVFTLRGEFGTPNDLKAEVQKNIDLIRSFVRGTRTAVSNFNQKLCSEVTSRVQDRKRLHDQGTRTVSQLGFKIRERTNRRVFNTPIARKRLAIQQIPGVPKSEPVLHATVFEEILTVVHHAMLAAERSPSAFKTMDEEDIRQVILLFLNAIFEGQGMAEAFNAAGKTDILIRHEDKNLFIAECKFWKGPESLSNALDQLLSYTTWRDTKTAIVLLNRSVEFSTVLGKIEPTVTSHPQFIDWAEPARDGRYRAIFRRPADGGSRLTVAVLAFDVPKP